MPDIIDANGLTVKTAAEITQDLTTGLQGIYGADINVDSNSPDGQTIGILTQMAVDIRELATKVYNNFDPDQAQGVILDQRIAVNNIRRAGGTYSVQPVEITLSKTTTLQGLDANYNDPLATAFTVQDATGNKFLLAATATLLAGIHTVNFRAQKLGPVNVPAGTITIPVTVVDGVTAVGNASTALSVGQIQEADPQVRTRRAQSTALASNGYLNGLLAAIRNLTGVTEAELYDNRTSVTDANGIPGKSIWLIVDGGSNADIGNTIYAKLNAGPDMKGAQTYNITTLSGALFTARWDTSTPENLYIRFDLKTTVAGFSFALADIKQFMVDNKLYNIAEPADTATLTASAVAGVASQGGGGVPLNMEISLDGVSWVDYLDTSNLDKKFTLDISRITISVI